MLFLAHNQRIPFSCEHFICCFQSVHLSCFMIYNYSEFLQNGYQIPEFFHYHCSYQQSNHRNLCLLSGFRILIGNRDGFYRSMYNTTLQHAPVYNGIYFLDSAQLSKNSSYYSPTMFLSQETALICNSGYFPFPLRVFNKQKEKEN